MQTMTFPTVETVVNAALNESLGTSNRTPTALQDAALIRVLDEINRRFVNAAHSREPSRGWEWMEDVVNFQTKNSTTLNGAITTASTSVVLTSGTDFDTAGRIWIRTANNAIDYVDHTGKSTHTLTGATDIDISHASGEHVEKCYALPSDYAKAAGPLLIDQQEYFYVKTRHLPQGRTFTTRGAYIVLPEDIGTHDATLWYEKTPTDLSSGSDASSITTDKAKSLNVPEDFMRFPIEKLKAYIYRVDGQDERVADCEAQAAQALEDALNYAVSTSTSLSLRPSY